MAKPKRLPMRWSSDTSAAAFFQAPRTTKARRDQGRSSLLHRCRSLSQFARADDHRTEAPREYLKASIGGAFAYMPGPAYGVLPDDLLPDDLLPDDHLPGLRRQVRDDSDFGDLLASASKRSLTTHLAGAAARYDGARLRTAEEARDRTRQAVWPSCAVGWWMGPYLSMPAGGSSTSDFTGSVAIPGPARCSFTISPFPLNGVISTARTVSDFAADGTTFRAGYRATRRRHIARGRPDRHSQLQVGS